MLICVLLCLALLLNMVLKSVVTRILEFLLKLKRRPFSLPAANSIGRQVLIVRKPIRCFSVICTFDESKFSILWRIINCFTVMW